MSGNNVYYGQSFTQGSQAPHIVTVNTNTENSSVLTRIQNFITSIFTDIEEFFICVVNPNTDNIDIVPHTITPTPPKTPCPYPPNYGAIAPYHGNCGQVAIPQQVFNPYPTLPPGTTIIYQSVTVITTVIPIYPKYIEETPFPIYKTPSAPPMEMAYKARWHEGIAYWKTQKAKINTSGSYPAPQINRMYVDMGMLFGSPGLFIGSWNSWPYTLNEQAVNSGITSFVLTAKAAGINEFVFAFSQVTDIDMIYSNGNFESGYTNTPSDADDALWNTVFCSINPQIFHMLTNLCRINGVTTTLSFGGEDGTLAVNWQICQSGETGAGQAQKLLQIMENYEIYNLNFDIEDPAVLSYGTNSTELISFFTTMKSLLIPYEDVCIMTLALDASVTNWPENYVKPMFDAGINNQFNEIFDMTYGPGYYLDYITNEGWGIQQYMQFLGSLGAMLGYGYTDQFDYSSNANNANTFETPYIFPPGITDTEGAALLDNCIMQQAANDTSLNGVMPNSNRFIWLFAGGNDPQPYGFTQSSGNLTSTLNPYFIAGFNAASTSIVANNQKVQLNEKRVIEVIE